MVQLKKWLDEYLEYKKEQRKWKAFVQEHENDFRAIDPHERYANKLLWWWLGSIFISAFALTPLSYAMIIALPIAVVLFVAVSISFFLRARVEFKNIKDIVESIKREHNYKDFHL